MTNNISSTPDIDKQNSIESNRHWYAIYVRSRFEKKVHQLFEENKIESSLPLIKTVRIWSDRKQKVTLPLFRGYIFVHINYRVERFDVLQTDGVVRFVSIGGEVPKIPEKQMHWIHMLVDESDTVRREMNIPVGQKVRVTTGPFKDTEGVVTRIKNETRLTILIESIMQAVSVEIDPEYLVKI
jgi:transcription antitermination factor NusG